MKTLICFLLAMPVGATTLSNDISRIVSGIDAVVGVAAVDFDTGETVSIRGDEPFPMASVFKFPLAIEVLHRVDAGSLRLDQPFTLTPAEFSLGHSPLRDAAKGKPVTLKLRELVAAAVSNSDNTAGDFLLVLVTPAAVTERMRALGAGGIRSDRPEKDIIPTFRTREGIARYAVDPRDTATPLAATALLRAFHGRHDGLSPASHDFLAQAMTRSANPVRIARRLPKGTTVAHKTGTMPGTLNDIGIISSADGRHHIALAIFTKAAKRSSEAEREAVIAEIARTVYSSLSAK